ncbi:MAG: hypothetical protein HN416_11830 [Nitrospina sp.]|jgi:hypothetical protein|nr:hypothetical protein [Nitrospina sp.]
MNTAEIRSIVLWLATKANELKHGECSIVLKIRDGHVQQILKSYVESELPEQESLK